MKRFVAVLLGLIMLTNCTTEEQAKDTKQKAAATKKQTPKKEKPKAATTVAATVPSRHKLEFVKSIPGSIDGCGEFFTFDTCKLSDEKYIFLSDMGDMAIMRVKGKDITLKKSSRESKQLNVISSVEVYYAIGYKVVLRKKEVKVVDQYYEYTGTLEVTGKKLKVTYKVKGEGGC